jgi:sulfate permease, SulP family
LAPTALAVTLFALTEAVSIGRSLAARGGYRIDGNQEFIGQGLSNIAGSFFSAYVATGSFNRSGVNYAAGARTPLAAIFAGVLLIGIVPLVAPYASYLPTAAMAGLLFLVAWGLDRLQGDRAHPQGVQARDLGLGGDLLLRALPGARVRDLRRGVAVAGALSGSHLQAAYRHLAPDPRLPNRAFSSEPDVAQCPQLRIMRIDGSLFFGSVAHVESAFDRLRAAHPQQKHLAILADGINFVDLQGGETLVREAKRRQADGGGLYLINVKAGLWERWNAAVVSTRPAGAMSFRPRTRPSARSIRSWTSPSARPVRIGSSSSAGLASASCRRPPDGS